MIRGIIFDFDGLILDTESCQFRIIQKIFEEHGCELPIERWQQEVGTKSGFSPFQYLQEQVGKEIDYHLIKANFKNTFHKTLETEQARPGVEDYLKQAKDLNLKIGLASSSNYQWVSTHLKNLGIYHYFDCIRTSDHVEKVKPDPALYRQAAECLRLKVEECLAFEDSANGALAAKRAGMSCVDRFNEVTRTMSFCEVDHYLDSMRDIELQELIAKI